MKNLMPRLERPRTPKARWRGLRLHAVILILVGIGAVTVWTWDGQMTSGLTRLQLLTILTDPTRGHERVEAALEMFTRTRREVFEIRKLRDAPQTPPALKKHLDGILADYRDLPTQQLPPWWIEEQKKKGDR